MHRLLLLLPLALTPGCASQSSSTYSQAAPNPFPAPPMAPAGRGAPVVGQPGQPGAQQPQEYPRSPHARPLPPSSEPGLWAGDEPRASRSSRPPLPEILGVELPALASPNEEPNYGPSRVCEAMWGGVLPGSRLADRVTALRPATKRCVVANMFRTCVLLLEGLEDVKNEQGVVVLVLRRHRAKLRASADDFTREACKEPLTPEAARLLDRLRAALEKNLNEPVR